MGGNLYKESKRIDTLKFNMYGLGICRILEHDLNLDSCLVQYYLNKKDHGDIDILVFIPESYNIESILNYLNDISELYKIHKNGNVISFLYYETQVDLILINEQFKETAKLFYFYNDFGLLIGKIFYYNRLKFSPEGVKYKVKYLQYSKEIKVFDDINDIFNYLGLDKLKYLKGFKELYEMFEYVTRSTKFCKEAFDMSLWRSDQRHRDLKRKNLLEFYEWIKPTDLLKSIERPTPEETFNYVNDLTNGAAQNTLNELIEIDNIKKQIAEKFNGNFLIEHFPEFKKDNLILGKFIKTYKSKFENDKTFLNHLQNMDIFEYLDDLKEHLKNMK